MLTAKDFLVALFESVSVSAHMQHDRTYLIHFFPCSCSSIKAMFVLEESSIALG